MSRHQYVEPKYFESKNDIKKQEADSNPKCWGPAKPDIKDSSEYTEEGPDLQDEGEYLLEYIKNLEYSQWDRFFGIAWHVSLWVAFGLSFIIFLFGLGQSKSFLLSKALNPVHAATLDIFILWLGFYAFEYLLRFFARRVIGREWDPRDPKNPIDVFLCGCSFGGVIFLEIYWFLLRPYGLLIFSC